MTSIDDTTEDAQSNRPSRRTFVGMVGAAVTVGIAGCSDSGEESTPDDPAMDGGGGEDGLGEEQGDGVGTENDTLGGDTTEDDTTIGEDNETDTDDGMAGENETTIGGENETTTGDENETTTGGENETTMEDEPTMEDDENDTSA